MRRRSRNTLRRWSSAEECHGSQQSGVAACDLSGGSLSGRQEGHRACDQGVRNHRMERALFHRHFELQLRRRMDSSTRRLSCSPSAVEGATGDSMAVRSASGAVPRQEDLSQKAEQERIARDAKIDPMRKEVLLGLCERPWPTEQASHRRSHCAVRERDCTGQGHFGQGSRRGGPVAEPLGRRLFQDTQV